MGTSPSIGVILDPLEARIPVEVFGRPMSEKPGALVWLDDYCEV